ncbi:metal ABC transporter ATP-binding protein [Neokomagataea thailandica NBRC 106555]|uniref:ATP-binding cassette domain-containing protein n=2 Tax=Neokomagataea TaxID=1223423 RepID=A0A4Y6VA53_9PROT|nr:MULTISPECIES: ATP-binding cassette domain-containing protein [Neokomagataea]QDH25225.1 ATP-binding cassette domain-containing protein [Neokomagataea tanensis]GBR54081.1 metal ABC transporter ATP-binding protein [Neokomagataea thailandica NBRC 106555]
MQRSTEAGPILSLKNVTLAHGSKRILRSCTCEIPLHGLTLLSGRNGAGKSTFLQAVLGIIQPVDGEILLDGQPVRRVRSQLGYMPQGRSEMPGRTEAALAIPALAHIRSALNGASWGFWGALGQQKKLLNSLLERAEIPSGRTSYVHRPLGQLSGGERQRVALAQALAPLGTRNNAVLLLDEPIAALDQAGRDALLGLLKQLVAAGTSIILTSHDMAGLEAMASRTVTLLEETVHVCV